jgi:2,4-dienoyl-CoA reductase-like NADH-dependent reductase (Old Yellow Enzyme family)/NADH dehydrogenase FAD-containing subunit
MPLSHLLSPGRIGVLEVRNRIVMAPMGSNLGEPTGHAGERLIRYYEARARGGVGLIIVGVGAVAHPAGVCIPNQVAISNDAFLPGLQELTGRVHAHGAKIAIQLQHGGKVARQDMEAGRPMWVPSVPELAAGDLLNDLTPEEIQGIIGHLGTPGAAVRFHEMTTDDIAALIEMFASAALRARCAGFDGVEIHAAHGYLLAAFLSAASNTRTDAYGGSLERRARLLVETIRAAKERAGNDFPVWCRLDGMEYHIPGGITPEDAARAAAIAADAGADAVHVSAYADPKLGAAFTDAPLVHQPCGYVPLAVAIKRRIAVPVIAVGRIEPDEAERLIAAGDIDFVAMARKLLADPELPNKLAQGRPEDVRPCTYGYTCVGNIYLNREVACAVNPATGREADFEIGSAPEPRRILIAGGGPAGMETARVAALRGHQVTLCERSIRLGGAFLLASLVYEPNGALLEHLEAQLRSLPIDVRLDHEVTPALVQALQPDVTIVAIGARQVRPDVPGVERPHVLPLAAGPPAVRGRAPGARAVVIHGGGAMGIEVAEFLSPQSATVCVIEEGATLGAGMALPRRWRALAALRQRAVDLRCGARLVQIDEETVRIQQNGVDHTIAADYVLLAAIRRENRDLAGALAGLGSRVHLIGDCDRPADMQAALTAAARLAHAL